MTAANLFVHFSGGHRHAATKIKNLFSVREEVRKFSCALLIFSQTADGLSWNWHLDIEDALQPVAVVSSGQIPPPL